MLELSRLLLTVHVSANQLLLLISFLHSHLDCFNVSFSNRHGDQLFVCTLHVQSVTRRARCERLSARMHEFEQFVHNVGFSYQITAKSCTRARAHHHKSAHGAANEAVEQPSKLNCNSYNFDGKNLSRAISTAATPQSSPAKVHRRTLMAGEQSNSSADRDCVRRERDRRAEPLDDQ